MIITIKHKFTPRAIEALAEAGNFNYAWDYQKAGPKAHTARSSREFMCAGYRFKNAKEFGEWMIAQANAWMIDNGQFNLDRVRGATDSAGFKMFWVD